MRFTFTPEQEAFRQEVRAFIEAEWPAEKRSDFHQGLEGPIDRDFSRKMAEKGWIGLTWPKQFGGQGRTYVEKMIMMEELLKAKAPIGYHFMADRQVGPALISFGSDWLKDYFIPRIIHADDDIHFCLLFSEPNAGSDLAASATKAVKDGDHYIIDGQKVWTTMGHVADYGWLLARTDFDEASPKHRTFSEFILDLRLPGVTVRPIENMVGKHSFNEVFFDGVRVHEKYLVGQVNAGFKQIMAQVDYERAGIERIMQNHRIHALLKEHVQNLDKEKDGSAFSSWAKDQMALLETAFTAGRLLCYYTAWTVDQGRKPTSQAALCKAFCTQQEQQLNHMATKILGPASLIRPGTAWSAFDGILADAYLWGPSYTLQGGSVEVLKNIVAQRGLGLPRS